MRVWHHRLESSSASRSTDRGRSPSLPVFPELGELTEPLSQTGRWSSGCDSEVSERDHARFYSFTLAGESEVTITLESDDADTYLYLRSGLSQSGAHLHENDDHNGSTGVSQIQETLSAGTYTI